MNSFTINKIKTNELKTIGHYTGYVCIVIGLFMIIPIICAIIFHDEVKYLNSFAKILHLSTNVFTPSEI